MNGADQWGKLEPIAMVSKAARARYHQHSTPVIRLYWLVKLG